MNSEEISKLSDFELNKSIAEALGFHITQEHMANEGHVHVWNDNGFIRRIPDYCNNWNDLMPLVVKYKLCLSNLYDNTDWAAIKTDYKGYQRHVVINKNPKRALAECLYQVLLNIKESNKEDR